MSRPPSPTPLNRDARWVVHPGAFWEDALDDSVVHEWVGQLRADLQPHTTGALWLNWIGDEGSARVRAAFGEDSLARLCAVKEVYDPENVFRSNHNIAPSSALGARGLS